MNNLETKIPNPKDSFISLLRSDLTTQWRNRRSVIMSLLVPIIILITWKGLIERFGGAFVISISLTIGLTSIGMMGYAITVARDRDKGIFQRLRVTPMPNSFIMMSRLAVQLGMIILLTLVVFIVGYQVDKISLTPAGYALTFITAFLGGALYLGLGQMIVGLLKSAETVNATTRLVYIAFIMLGMFGEISNNAEFKQIVHWSPFGTVKTVLAAATQPSNWSNDASSALLLTIGYAVVFCFLGIKWFRWNSAASS